MLEIARESIRRGLQTRQPLQVPTSECVGTLGERLGSFVTLSQQGRLRGCVGIVESKVPLAVNVATSAFNAAFHDARFTKLTAPELGLTQIEISVLSALRAIHVESEADLIATLKPHEDGLVIKDRDCHAVFLPKVWEKLPEPDRFVRELKCKAQLGANHWSETVCCYRFQTTSFAE